MTKQAPDIVPGDYVARYARTVLSVRMRQGRIVLVFTDGTAITVPRNNAYVCG